MPGESAPHDFYDDVRYMFYSTLPKGTVIKLQVDSGLLARKWKSVHSTRLSEKR